jgi:hypothetical protein
MDMECPYWMKVQSLAHVVFALKPKLKNISFIGHPYMALFYAKFLGL